MMIMMVMVMMMVMMMMVMMMVVLMLFFFLPLYQLILKSKICQLRYALSSTFHPT